MDEGERPNSMISKRCVADQRGHIKEMCVCRRGDQPPFRVSRSKLVHRRYGIVDAGPLIPRAKERLNWQAGEAEAALSASDRNRMRKDYGLAGLSTFKPGCDHKVRHGKSCNTGKQAADSGGIES